jgi:hypothetical protein
MGAAAIMSIVTLGMASTINHMGVQSRALSEKLASMDLEKLLIASLSDGSVCNYLLKDKTFNSNLSLSPTSPLVISFPSTSSSPTRIYASYNPTATTPLGPVVAEVGQLASPYSESLKVSAINLELTGRSGASFTGRWRVDFDGTKLVRPIKPIYVSVTLGTETSNPTAAKITSCQGAGGTSTAPLASSGHWCGAFVGTDGYPADRITTVSSNCEGQVPVCSMPMPTAVGTGCYSYDSSSVCPSGYTLTKVMSTGLYSTGDGVHGMGEVGGPSTTYTYLYTCMH